MNKDDVSRAVAPVEDPPPSSDVPVSILIVDDDPNNLAVLETVLDDPGYRLVRAGSGDQALLALMSDEFAVLVLDVRMPGMTGLELARIIKERKKTARVPIIFLTAYEAADQHVLEGYGSGAVDYLHKPVDAAVLRSKVAVFAELHRKSRALVAANAALLAEVSERCRAETRLRELNETLDQRVAERTRDLERMEAQLREADHRKDEFLATLAHELRNPLAPVRNAVHILEKMGPAANELQWARSVIERQVQAMSRLIDDLMDVSRISRGKIELRRQRIDLATVLRDAVETSRPWLDECGHQLVLTLCGRPMPVDADLTRLAQVFMNLLNNAAKFMDRGGRIELAARQDGGEIVVTVKDTGIGIAADRLASIFEMFSQVEAAMSRSRGGLGIGLSLAQRLVEMHGGSIEARSPGLGHGSEFVVRLPAATERRREPQANESLADPSAARGTGPGLRMLVADDNQDAAATLALLLEVSGHSVRYAYDGEAAVRAAAEFDPHVVILDIGMPKLNGYEACRQIRALPEGAAMILVAITGWGQPEDRRKSKEAGFDAHLVKPVLPDALEELIVELTAQRQPQPGQDG